MYNLLGVFCSFLCSFYGFFYIKFAKRTLRAAVGRFSKKILVKLPQNYGKSRFGRRSPTDGEGLALAKLHAPGWSGKPSPGAFSAGDLSKTSPCGVAEGHREAEKCDTGGQNLKYGRARVEL